MTNTHKSYITQLPQILLSARELLRETLIFLLVDQIEFSFCQYHAMHWRNFSQ